MAKSEIWQWFKKVVVDDQVKVKCTASDEESKVTILGIANGTTSSMRYHLEHKHQEKWCYLRVNEQKRKFDNSELNDIQVRKRVKVERKKYDLKSEEQLQRDMSVMKWIAANKMSITTVNSPTFHEMIRVLCPKFNVKHISIFAKYKLPLLYQGMKKRLLDILAKELPKCQKAALTFATWTSHSNNAYEATTLHYINETFKLRKWVLGITPLSAGFIGQKIADFVDKLVADIEALRCVKKLVVVDQTQIISSAVKDSKKVACLDYESIQYADHKFNTVLSNTIERVTELKDAIDARRKVITSLYQSPLAQQQLKIECELQNC